MGDGPAALEAARRDAEAALDPDTLAALAAAAYRIVRRVGAGTYAVVLEAAREGGGARPRRVALKVARKHDEARVGRKAHVGRELAAHAAMNSRAAEGDGGRAGAAAAGAALMVYRPVETASHVVLVFEYCEGGSLLASVAAAKACGGAAPCFGDEQCGAGSAGEAATGAVLVQLAGALAHAHAAGVVHRDVSMGNVLRCGAGRDLRVKLCDWGCAEVAAGACSRRGARGRLVGTPDYIAPEAAAGAPHGPASDVWSLGIVLLKLLLGGRGTPELLAHVRARGLSARRAGTLGLSAEASDALCAMLVLDPARRVTAAAAADLPLARRGAALLPPRRSATPQRRAPAAVAAAASPARDAAPPRRAPAPCRAFAPVDGAGVQPPRRESRDAEGGDGGARTPEPAARPPTPSAPSVVPAAWPPTPRSASVAATPDHVNRGQPWQPTWPSRALRAGAVGGANAAAAAGGDALRGLVLGPYGGSRGAQHAGGESPTASLPCTSMSTISSQRLRGPPQLPPEPLLLAGLPTRRYRGRHVTVCVEECVAAAARACAAGVTPPARRRGVMELRGVTRACGLRLEHGAATCLALALDAQAWACVPLGALPDSVGRLYTFAAKLAGILAAASPALVLRSIERRAGGGARARLLAAYMRAPVASAEPDFVLEVDGWCVRVSRARGAALVVQPGAGGTRVKCAWPPAQPPPHGARAGAPAPGGGWDVAGLLALASERMRAVDAAVGARGGLVPGEPTVVEDEDWPAGGEQSLGAAPVV